MTRSIVHTESEKTSAYNLHIFPISVMWLKSFPVPERLIHCSWLPAMHGGHMYCSLYSHFSFFNLHRLRNHSVVELAPSGSRFHRESCGGQEGKHLIGWRKQTKLLRSCERTIFVSCSVKTSLSVVLTSLRSLARVSVRPVARGSYWLGTAEG
jgi:hypothetical protein